MIDACHDENRMESSTKTTEEGLSASLHTHSMIHKTSIRGARNIFRMNFIVDPVLSEFIISEDM